MSKSPITAAKNAQGFVPATLRKRCATCQHVREVYGSTWQCGRGGFLTSIYAVCEVWTIKQPPGFKAPTG